MKIEYRDIKCKRCCMEFKYVKGEIIRVKLEGIDDIYYIKCPYCGHKVYVEKED